MKIDKNIQITYSTNSTHLAMSSKTRELILDALSKRFTRVGQVMINCESDLNKLLIDKPDLVFLGMKDKALPSTRNTNIYLSDFLNENNILCVGSSKKARKLSSNKYLAKELVRDAGILTADFFLAHPGQFTSAQDLPLEFPLFIKPPSRSKGSGIDSKSVARDFTQYVAKIEQIYNKYQSKSLVEKYLSGREFSVAILERPNNKQPLTMPIELIAKPNIRGDRLLGLVEKTEDKEKVVLVNDPPTAQKLKDTAIKVFKILGARDYARIDFRMDDNGQIFFLEANTLPGLGYGYFYRACQLNYSLDYDSIIIKLVEQGLNTSLQQSLSDFNLSDESVKSIDLHGARSA